MKARQIIKRISYGFVLFFACIGIYLLAAFIGSLIPYNVSFRESPQATVTIYLLSNGVHTDIVLPLHSANKNWATSIDLAEITPNYENAKFIAFGWGDRKFYLETPTWSDLTLLNALYALFIPSQSAMHVTLMQDIITNEWCVPIRVTEEQFSCITNYIDDSFQRRTNGKFILIPNLRYYDYDAFYEATGSFHLFFTCNTWTNKGLQTGGLRAALWTPFDKGILYHYR